VQLQRKSRNILLPLYKCAGNPVRFFFKYPTEISVTSLVQMGIGIIKKMKTLSCAKLGHYIHEAFKENLQASSAAEEVSARTALFQAAQYCQLAKGK
jgi:hypothetical protein